MCCMILGPLGETQREGLILALKKLACDVVTLSTWASSQRTDSGVRNVVFHRTVVLNTED